MAKVSWAMTPRLKMDFFLDQVLFSQFQKCKRLGNVDIRRKPNKCLTKIAKNIKHKPTLRRVNLAQKRSNINICAIIGPFMVRTFHGIPGYSYRRFVFPAGGHIDFQLPWSFEQTKWIIELLPKRCPTEKLKPVFPPTPTW